MYLLLLFLKESVTAQQDRTFAVVLNTSGSMDTKLLGKALGAIASYSMACDVSFVRAVFCDIVAYDVVYLSPENITGLNLVSAIARMKI